MELKFGILFTVAVIFILISSTNIMATKVLPPDYGTDQYAQKSMQEAKIKIDAAETKLTQIIEKRLDKQTEASLQKVLAAAKNALDEAKGKYSAAQEAFNKNDYYEASSNSVGSRNLADYAILYFDKILSGAVTEDDFLRVDSIQDQDKSADDEKQPSEGIKEVTEITKKEEQTIKEDKKMIIAENEGYKTAIIQPGKDIIIKDEKREIMVPKEGFKTVVSIEYGEEKPKEVTITSNQDKTAISVGGATGRDCEEYLKECNSGNNVLCEKWNTNCQEKNITAETKEEIKIKDNKIYINDKEIKIMPDTASENAIETLQLKKDVVIELKDTGKPFYEVTGTKEAKILALFKTEMQVKTEVDAETGKLANTEKPWWSFLAKE